MLHNEVYLKEINSQKETKHDFLQNTTQYNSSVHHDVFYMVISACTENSLHKS